MPCRFKGHFSEADRRHITQAIRTVERLRGSGQDAGCWVTLHFNAPCNGYPYWGIRLRDGHTVRAHTARGLAVALESLRDEMLRVRSQALCQGSEQATQFAIDA